MLFRSEAESQQKKPRQQGEPEAQDPGPSEPQDASPTAPQSPGSPSPEEEQLKPRTRTSAGRGLSRLFSSFLKRRSQCEGEAGEKDHKGEDEPKAPIADPEPELRLEGDAALDQHSVSSVEAQVQRGSRMAERLGNRARNQKVAGLIPGRAK